MQEVPPEEVLAPKEHELAEESPKTAEMPSEKEARDAESKSDRERWQQQVEEAKRNAQRQKPPDDVYMFASAIEMGNKFGVGVGLYLKTLEWLLILFACITFLAIPYWIVINASVFTDEAHKDDHEFGVKIYSDPSLLSTTFAGIVDRRVDPNSTLTWMNTELGNVWHGPMKKNDFLLWISLLDVVGVVLMVILVSLYTWKSRKFENDVDVATLDLTDYSVLVTGLPRHAGVHEVGQFFSKFGEVMDVTLLLDMSKVLRACAKASHLESKRELQAAHQVTKEQRKRLEKTDKELHKVLQKIDDDMNKHIAKRNKQIMKAKAKMERQQSRRAGKAATQENQADDVARGANQVASLTEQVQDDAIDLERYNAGQTIEELMKESVYDTKAAFVTFNRMSEQRHCLKECPSLGWAGRLYGRSAATNSQLMRDGKYILKAQRAGAPSDYIFENMTVHRFNRFMHLLLTRTVILIILIACAIIVTGLSSIEVLERSELNWEPDLMKEDIGRAGSVLASSTNPVADPLYDAYEAAMRDAAGTPDSTPSFTPNIATRANFTDYCTLALPDMCAPHYRDELAVDTLKMRWGLHFIWGKTIDKLLNQRPLLASMEDLADSSADDPNSVQGADKGLPSCLACYCMGLYEAQEGGDASTIDSAGKLDSQWLAQTQAECDYYLSGFDVKAWGTRVAVSIVIALLNISLKLLVQFLGQFEMHWTQSDKERSFAVVAFISQLLNTVLVLLLVNARPAANATPSGDRVGEDNIQWLRYILLSGRFDDFSPRWYQYVGVSIMTLLFIQTIFPLVNVGIEMMIRGIKLGILLLKGRASQDEFDSAYAYPKFLLQQRVADVMLNVSVALMFCSGMPLCAAVVCVVFSVALLMDRYAITNLMAVNTYGPQLPRLIIFLLPWAVFFHCLFGLWQHTYFMLDNVDNETTAIFIELGKGDADDARDAGDFFGEFIDGRGVVSRISQHNGFGLLLCAFIMFLWLLFRFVTLLFIAPLIRRWVRNKEEVNASTGGGASGAGRLRLARKLLAMPAITAFPGLEEPDTPEDTPPEADQDGKQQGKPSLGGTDQPRDPTFEEALTKSDSVLAAITGKRRVVSEALKRLPTYRLPYQPEYSNVFRGLLHSAIWLKMNGPERFTRLVPIREDVHAQPDPSAPNAKDTPPSDAVQFMDSIKTAEPLDEDASTKDYIRGGSLMRANKGVRVDTSSIRWVISRELILSAGDLELNEAALEEAYIERGLGSELATHVASIIASSQGTHSRKPSVTGSQAAHSRKPSIAGSQAAHSRKNSNVPKAGAVAARPPPPRSRLGAAGAPAELPYSADAAVRVEPQLLHGEDELQRNPLGETSQSLMPHDTTLPNSAASLPLQQLHLEQQQKLPKQQQQPPMHPGSAYPAVLPQQTLPQPQQQQPEPGTSYPAVLPYQHQQQQPPPQPGTAYVAVLPQHQMLSRQPDAAYPAVLPRQQQQEHDQYAQPGATYPPVAPYQQQQQQPHQQSQGDDVRYPSIQP
mmetsp:Transcript_8781/g.23606  ORF Transcript_8781/g.23606 Transcript_8781/m.23606 type:complete len:1501 (+) Transcript_8781:117-4619(+)